MNATPTSFERLRKHYGSLDPRVRGLADLVAKADAAEPAREAEQLAAGQRYRPTGATITSPHRQLHFALHEFDMLAIDVERAARAAGIAIAPADTAAAVSVANASGILDAALREKVTAFVARSRQVEDVLARLAPA